MMNACIANSRLLAWGLIAIVVTACTDHEPSLVEPNAPLPQWLEEPGKFFAPYGSIDSIFLAVNEEVPGFGGMIFEDGDPVLRLVSGTRATEALAALADHLPGRGLTAAAGRWQRADFEWKQLAGWHAAILPLLVRDDVVFTDADEGLNRIVVGVLEGTNEDDIIQAAVARGVPVEALILRVTEPPVALQSLRDRIRPTRGGLRINRVTEDPCYSPGCTMGFNVDFGGVRTFMTNSHCTDVFGETTGTVFFQSTWGVSDHRVGTEHFDPPLVDFGAFCPSGRDDCRWSDAALVAFNADVDWAKGAIARTSSSHRWNGSRNIVDNFWITNKHDPPAVGEWLHKMGATTGWTYGDVDQTCVSYSIGGVYLMCQDLVNAGVMSCDSGSPVFRRIGAESEVALAGILWGGHPSGTAPGARFIFSRIGAVEQDFGSSLDVIGTPPLTGEIRGADTVEAHVYCSWNSAVAGGTSPYSYEWRRDGQVVSTSNFYETFDTGSSDFVLELRVSDGSNPAQTAFDYLGVTVTEWTGGVICAW
jgi:hypothetical protein